MQVLFAPEHAHMRTCIQASIDAGVSPTAMFFDDVSNPSWTKWDFRFLKAYRLYEMYDRDGIPVWLDESDRVMWEVLVKTSRRRQAVERAQGKKKLKEGSYIVAKPKVMDGGGMPTKAEWLENLKELGG